MASGRIKNLPRSTRRYGFALTPLADAMFQLLVFFMLTSSLTPYSLLTLSPGSSTSNAAPGEGAEVNQPTSSAVWKIANGEITSNGQHFQFDQLANLAQALIAAKTQQVLLISTPSAQVQDLVNVLEALTTAGISAVQIARSER